METTSEDGLHRDAGRSPEEWRDQTERNRRFLEAQQERLQDLTARMAETEETISSTLQHMAERARAEGRADDAERLAGKAGAARRFAEHERQQVRRMSEGDHGPPFQAGRWREDAGARDEQAARDRDEAGRGRDDAAQGRDDAARERDTAAGGRDDDAIDRVVARGRRDAAAERRQDEEAGWERPAADLGEPTPEQRELDAESRASRRERAVQNLTQAAADRAADADDRAADSADRDAALRDRLAAAQDRADAQADREQAGRDRAAAEADREQAEVDQATWC
jgi:hypothetical protein